MSDAHNSNRAMIVVRTVAVAAVLAASIWIATAVWGGDGDDGSSSTTSTTQPVADSATDPCEQHMPGDLLTEEQAVVRFSTERVCLGYVTVAPVIRVSWLNEDSRERSVTVVETATKAEVFASKVGPGQTISHLFPTGIYTYTVDALPSFRGTIEVVAAA